jgi:DNA-binding CsgD family transcriptional regulator
MTDGILAALLDSIYAAAEDQRHWEVVLSSLASHLSARGGVSFGIVRDVRSDLFALEQVSFVQRLGPHILRAVSLNRRLAALAGERRAFESALDRLHAAAFLLDEKGAIFHCNCAATELLKVGDGITAVRGRLVATSANSQAHFAELVRAAVTPKEARGGSSSLLRKHSARPLIARVMPFGQRGDFWLTNPVVRAIVFISDPDQSPGDAIAETMDLYGLTPSEKRLLSELLAGSTVQEAADTLSTARTTGRNRLARIMAKTATNRQGELLQLICKGSSPTR